MSFRQMDPVRVRRMPEEGRRRFKFMATLYQLQIDCGRSFDNEHLATAVSLDERCRVEILVHNDVHLTKAGQ